MDWGLLGSPKWMNVLPPPPHPLPFSSSSSSSPPPPPPPPPSLSPSLVLPSNLENKINPSILLIIMMLAVIFFVSGLLHLLARCLLRPTDRDPEDPGSATAMQGQLQQLFHLHDSGVNQSFIDTLPLFLYKAIIGIKSPFDCAVCLCEFEPDDKLRLLPKCSHAFHMECIDTWLLSHSTCPLCRGSLLADFSPACSPVVLLLESASESLRESGSERGDSWPNVQLGSIEDDAQRPGDVEAKEDAGLTALEVSKAKVVAVKLGKFRNVDAAASGGEGTSNGTGSSNLNDRRCFSMGSFEYVMDETTMLQVPIKPTKKKSQVMVPGHRLTMSECDCHSRRHGFKEFNPSRISESEGYFGSSSINPNKRESFSVSKIWLRSNKDKPLGAEDCSRRASSFRISVHCGASGESSKVKGSTNSRRTVSEFDVGGWMKHGNELGSDVEIASCNGSLASRAEETPSFARRTLLWIAGRQNRVVNHV